VPHQFDIVENPNVRARKEYPFLIILQSDRAGLLNTIVAAPLAPAAPAFERSRIHPIVAIDGTRYVVFTEYLAAISSRDLGRIVGSASDSRYDITRALDMLFTGV
jgi:toxin CcdB